MTTHYDVLGVEDDASADDIKRAYYDRARLFHPDAHVASPATVKAEAERAMQALNAAWMALRHPGARRRYDRQLLAAEPGAAAATVRTARAAIGSGFRYWLGASGGMLTGTDGRPRFNLQVTGSTLAPLRALAPDGLAGLHGQGTAIADRELEHLQGMRGLRYLDLSGTGVTDAGLVHLLGCTSLESLYLWDTAVSDDGLAVVGKIANLRHLGLGCTRVTDAGLVHLGGLTRLRSLQLWGTGVAGPGLGALAELPELERVTLPRRVKARYRRQLRSALVPL
ncbi:MAG: hypothetical protein QOF60_2841 [Actinomycetota bacterium]|nr:hypothetical protein [Actinomycetota bacterium]